MTVKKPLVSILVLVFPVCFSRAADFGAVDSFIADTAAVFGRRGVVVCAYHHDSLVYYHREGSMDTLDKWGIASASKWISSAVLLRCAELGYFHLDDTISRFIPAFSENGKGRITFRHCFTMSSGIYGGDRRYENLGEFTLGESADSIAVYSPLVYNPGEKWAYDGKGMQAAGAAAEIAAGKPWRELARELVLAPCGMDSTTYDQFGDLNPGVPGGVRSTAADYLRFLRMISNNGMNGATRVLSTSSIEEYWTDHNGDHPLHENGRPVWPVSHPDYQYGLDTVQYGYGSWIFGQNPATGAIEEISSPGLYGTFPWVDRRHSIFGICFMHNSIFGPRAYAAEITIAAMIREAIGHSATSIQLTPNNSSSNLHAVYFYVNPLSKSIHLTGLGNAIKSYSIFTISGQVVAKGQTQGNRIRMANLHSGTYLIKFNTGKNISIISKSICFH